MGREMGRERKERGRKAVTAVGCTRREIVYSGPSRLAWLKKGT